MKQKQKYIKVPVSDYQMEVLSLVSKARNVPISSLLLEDINWVKMRLEVRGIESDDISKKFRDEDLFWEQVKLGVQKELARLKEQYDKRQQSIQEISLPTTRNV